MMLSACGPKDATNPFFVEWDTPFQVPPFDKIKTEHFKPALEEGMKQQLAEIDEIVSNPEEPTFENTVAALDYTGSLLNKVLYVFYNYNSAVISPEIEALALEISPQLSAHSDNISLNAGLFERVRKVYEQKEQFGLSQEQEQLLEKTYKGFIRSGAAIPEEKQERFREINQRLATLSVQFGQNVLADVNTFSLVIEDEADLAGLPNGVIEAAAETAAQAEMEGKWMFTLQNPSVMPFLAYAENRELREKMQQAYINRGNNGNEFDNNAIIGEIVNLRLERANILGYDSHAAFILEENMAKDTSTVMSFLKRVWDYALPMAHQEAKMMQELIDARGGDYKLAAWDWRYYAEQVRKEKFDLDEEEIRQYFELGKVTEGVFMVIKRLWGLQFEERKDLPTYHEEATAYEVKEADGTHLGILYMDFHPRASKRSGAWMSSYRSQQIKPDGTFVHPIITIVCNFTKATASTPALLTFDEMRTYFHEIGHALHGLMSKATYPSLAGTSVSRDFVELPSQVMENWAKDPKVLVDFAFHYQTGEPMPQELMDKIAAAGNFDQGFATVEFVASGLLDMEYHTITSLYPEGQLSQVASMTNNLTIDKYKMMPEISFRHGSTHFQHIFSGGYSAGYYSYLWSGLLDADAYEAFRETGDLFDQAAAQRFRKYVLEAGGTADPMELYVKFRGAEPKEEHLLRQRGLIK
jgi:peptidyl-dipeptidase Dcp